MARAATRRVARSRPKIEGELARSRGRLATLRDLPAAIHVDRVLQLGGSAFYVRGWAAHDDEEAPAFAVIAGDRTAPLIDPLRFPRRGLDPYLRLFAGEAISAEPGLIGYVELAPGSSSRDPARLEMRSPRGGTRAVRMPAPLKALDENRSLILRDLVRFRRRRHELARHAFPAIERLQRSLAERTTIERVTELGERSGPAEVSVVVALDRGTEMLEHQLAQFAHQPDAAEADLLYVCDERELSGGLLDRAEDLFALYRVPFRLLGVSSAASFQAMTNLAVELATGALVVLLDPDVIPDHGGWLSAMRELHDASPTAGAVGPVLLYEDRSVRSAGASCSPSGQLVHRLQGSHRTAVAPADAHAVPMLSAACMMVSRERFVEAGGLRGRHLTRDYEGADLCLCLAEAGLEALLLPGVEAYHLEESAQRPPAPDAAAARHYDAWAHGQAWDAEAVMPEASEAAEPRLA